MRAGQLGRRPADSRLAGGVVPRLTEAMSRGAFRHVTTILFRHRPCPPLSSGRPPSPYVLSSLLATSTKAFTTFLTLRLVRSPASARSRPPLSRGKVRAPFVPVACCAASDGTFPSAAIVATQILEFLRSVDLVQDLYIKELKAYKAPAPVRDIFLNPPPRFIQNHHPSIPS